MTRVLMQAACRGPPFLGLRQTPWHRDTRLLRSLSEGLGRPQYLAAYSRRCVHPGILGVFTRESGGRGGGGHDGRHQAVAFCHARLLHAQLLLRYRVQRRVVQHLSSGCYECSIEPGRKRQNCAAALSHPALWCPAPAH